MNGDYSDLKIVCGPDTYHVHKAIICPQSGFFEIACRPDTFKEGKTGIVNIPISSGRDESSRPDAILGFDCDVDVETAACVKSMIHYFYHRDYPELDKTSLEGELWVQGALAHHSRMYAMGEKYDIAGMKAAALAKFLSLNNQVVTSGTLIPAIIIAFNSTLASDKDLREAVLTMVDDCRQLGDFLTNTQLQNIISTIPEIAYGLYRKAIEREKRQFDVFTVFAVPKKNGTRAV
jgi:hypothetical protein